MSHLSLLSEFSVVTGLAEVHLVAYLICFKAPPQVHLPCAVLVSCSHPHTILSTLHKRGGASISLKCFLVIFVERSFCRLKPYQSSDSDSQYVSI